MKTSKSKKIKHSSFWRRFLLVVLGLLVGVNVYLANARQLIGNQLPMPFGYGVAEVMSGSMEPTFSKNDLIIVKKNDDIKVGDIIVYQSGHTLIVHRVIALDDENVTTKGDANNVADPQFSRSEVKGTVVTWIPKLGVAVNVLKSPVGIIAVIVIAILLIEGSFKKQKKNDDDELNEIRKEIDRLKGDK